MARLSSITGLPAILAAADHWKQKCLLSDGSVLSDSHIWTAGNLSALDHGFTQNPYVGHEKFLDKLRKQLGPAPGSVKQLAAELLWLLFLFPSNITGAKKRQIVSEVWSWSETDILNLANPLLDVLDHGAGSGGTAFNNRRPFELSFAIRLAQRWKNLESANLALAADPWGFGNWVDGVLGTDNYQFRHMILFLLFPDCYESVSSEGRKRAMVQGLEARAAEFGISIVNAGQEQESARVAIDKSLLSIRQAFEKHYPGKELDFSEPPFAALWQKSTTTESKGESEDETSDQGFDGPSVWIEKTKVKGRLDREQGDHRLGVALWSPLKSKNGADIYKNMRAVAAGDLILHLIDNKQFAGVSVAAGSADSTFQGVIGTQWEGPCYRIRLQDYVPLDPPLAREDFLETPEGAAELQKVHQQYNGRGLFYTADLDLNQGAYLTKAPIELVEALNRIYLKLYGKAIPNLGAVDPEADLQPPPKEAYSIENAMSGSFSIEKHSKRCCFCST